ncbi:hypothetical protein Sjap_020246 [Stephania japonica]|uniref:Uncharacterized protein n=1 Tax=Stephania japonica TaxID=461633 RepID=A0AAP0F5U6_9MAGN
MTTVIGRDFSDLHQVVSDHGNCREELEHNSTAALPLHRDIELLRGGGNTGGPPWIIPDLSRSSQLITTAARQRSNPKPVNTSRTYFGN